MVLTFMILYSIIGVVKNIIIVTVMKKSYIMKRSEIMIVYEYNEEKLSDNGNGEKNYV